MLGGLSWLLARLVARIIRFLTRGSETVRLPIRNLGTFFDEIPAVTFAAE